MTDLDALRDREDLQRALGAATLRLDLRLGLISRVEGRLYEVLLAEARPELPVAPGSRFELGHNLL